MIGKKFKSLKKFQVLNRLDYRFHRHKNYFYSKDKPCAVSNDVWKSFPIQDIQQETHNAKRFRLSLGDPFQYFGLPISSYVKFRINNNNGESYTRSYTPISDNIAQGYVDFVIKLYNHDASDDKNLHYMSDYLKNLKIGDKIEMSGPFYKIEYPFQDKKKIGMIAGGTGITPMIQILKEMALNVNKDDSYINLLYANVTEDDILCERDLLGLKAILSKRLNIWHVIENPKFEHTMLRSWNPNIVGTGRITEKIIKGYLPAPSEDTLILVCGPPGMMEEISGRKIKKNQGELNGSLKNNQGELSGYLKNLGYTENMVYKM